MQLLWNFCEMIYIWSLAKHNNNSKKVLIFTIVIFT